jgi:hypothetical protein
MTATLPIANQFHYNVFALGPAMPVVAATRSDPKTQIRSW